MSDANQAADAGLVTLLGLLELSAAFDTVDHQILLNRLKLDYGITEWIQSYLTGHLIRQVQRHYFPDNDSHFWCPSRFRPRSEPVHSLFRGGHQHRRAPLS